ncbi:MAG: phenylalanine--tRNA ligase subunit beta [Oscillospiraceae bacterium]|nr:phenylalanine--tRNA ligase subunit beta [Oscillospiraceae bacterium]
MKVSLNWIKEYVALPEDMDLSRLAYDLTMATVEVEGVTNLADEFQNIIVGQITEVLPHPNAEKLRICKVDIGTEIKDIVCGGSNLEAGMKVAVACPGAMVRWHGEGEPVKIGLAKLRGVESYGMICASSEIGLFDLFPFEEEATIVDLSAFDAPAGTPIAEALGLSDMILEIDNKSLTNRPDLWGHYGIARELAALYDLPLKEIKPYEVPAVAPLTIEVADLERCPRYIGVELSNLSVKASPFAMQTMLWRVGQRPINALVDITNYVMMAVGQPTHAFDKDNIKDHIVVRRAKNEEELLLLNGKELALCEDDLVIADTQSPVGLAGVMGGAKDSVLPTTKTVILEIANFAAPGVRRTALRYDNRTEAVSRYEKGIDPERCDLALSLSMELFGELYPEVEVTAFSDTYPKKLECANIEVSLSWLESRLGKRIPNETIAKKMGAMGYTVAFEGDMMHITVPSWRSTGDVSIKADIMEEVARMYGYENFEATPITTSFEGAINQLDVDIERKAKEYLAIRCGMQEIFTYPWMSDECVDAILQDTTGIFQLSTPPSPTERYIRSSLLPNLAKAVAHNQRYFDEFAIFETAMVIRDEGYSAPYYENELLPSQKRGLAAAWVCGGDDVTSLFRRAKGAVELMPRYTHMEGFTLKQETKPVWADDVVWLNVFVGDVQVGNLALLAKKAALSCGIKTGYVMLFELDLDELVPFTSRTNSFEHLAEFPITDYDISLLFDRNTPWEKIRATALGCKGQTKALRDVLFVEEYKGKHVPEDKKSVTLRIQIGADDKTLTTEEIEAVVNIVTKKLTKNLGAEARTK